MSLKIVHAHGGYRIVNASGVTLERHGDETVAAQRLETLLGRSKVSAAAVAAGRPDPAGGADDPQTPTADDSADAESGVEPGDLEIARDFLRGAAGDVLERLQEFEQVELHHLAALRAAEEAGAAREVVLEAITKRMDQVDQAG